jgi:ADP-ribosylglycohydrolase
MIPRAILGALVGDAAGAVLELSRDQLTTEDVERALTFPGGGPHRIGPGQITDDGELTLTLWRSLMKGRTGESLLEDIRTGYVDWLYSVPFDVGATCRKAFDVWSDVLDGQMTAEEGERMVRQVNGRSEANGAMMRATAIASYVVAEHPRDHRLGLRLAKADALLSHPSRVCVEANQVYVLALMLLLEGCSRSEVVVALEDWIVRHVHSEEIHTWFFRESVELAVEGVGAVDVTESAGHVRWAFVLAMYCLRRSIGFEEALRLVLRLGGDTDTNACIVGGLVACDREVPAEWARCVVECDPTSVKGRWEGRWRPAVYSVKGVFS